ncbi:unnamed protein product [Adineta steineri]|uniref:Mutator-like transposase domain-containing protein n=1 Tax=Adineta steineri TaxID=433720 RepID=A0A815MEY5_9BILA|nr:unnamed protein product [Adineta steineri]
MEETNTDLTASEPIPRGVPGQPGILIRAGQPSIRVGDDDEAAIHVGADQSSIRGGDDDQAATRGGTGRSVRGDGDQAAIIEKGVCGTVITVNRLRHYAFIKRKNNMHSRDIFAREISIINEPINKRKLFLHDTCNFDLIRTQRGLEAINIQIVERNVDTISKCSRRRSSKRVLQNRTPESARSNATTTTPASSTTLKRSSLPLHEKIRKRIKSDVSLESVDSNVPMNGYTILQNQVLFSLMGKTNCESCGQRWNGIMNIKKREGLFLILSFRCSSCKNTINIETSPQIVSSARRDVNVRSQIGAHLCGIKYAGLVKLMGVMNLPSPIHDERYSKWNKDLLISIKSLSDRSMRKAVVEAVASANSTDLMVSGDGYWQTRGFQSRHGAAALISCTTAPKVIDIETCHKTCNTCMEALAIKTSDPNKYKDIIKSHQCEKNYDKSSGGMESSAVLSMFNRSTSKYGVDYTSYVGDGDSKAFNALSKAAPYPGSVSMKNIVYLGKIIKKIEDLNHFSKRMKRALETKKREYGKKKLSDGKTIGGKNRLSAQTIIRLQMTFRATIQKNKHDLELLYKRSWAIFYHKYSTNNDPHHNWCSVKWCGYLKSVKDNTPYDHTTHTLAHPVLDAIKPVFKSLCSRESLSRVVNASSQNANECFHSIVWLTSPKHKATSGTIFEIASHLAAIIFNDGYFGLGDLLDIVCGYFGFYAQQAMIYLDNNRLHTESKESNRKRKKEASRTSQKNDNNKQTGTDDEQSNDDTEESDDCNEQSSDDTEESNDCNEQSSDDTEVSDHCAEQSSDDDYGYYNAKDKRLWKEKE